eukprot:TRINITY_DN7295_c0_g1_i1.p1 TRINITY_DN7295_c0_g1~~TRINITY_DN7295_c0_g1_i1.p1  ORF type:complete len:443 (-),score=223.71 TRINITY_DN7295_c0_g1_i1:432-1760(-)
MSKWVIGSVVGSVAVGAAAFMYLRSKKGGDEKKTDEVPKISEEQLVNIFKQLNHGLTQAAMQFTQLRTRYKTDAQIQQQFPTEDALNKYLEEQAGAVLQQSEGAIYNKMGFAEKDVRIAAAYYAEKPAFKEQTENLKNIYGAMKGDKSAIEVLPKDKFLKVLVATFSASSSIMESVVTQIIKEGNLNDDSPALANQRFAPLVDKAREVIHAQSGVSEEEMAAASQHYKNDKDFIQAFVQLQMRHRQSMSNAGRRLMAAKQQQDAVKTVEETDKSKTETTTLTEGDTVIETVKVSPKTEEEAPAAESEDEDMPVLEAATKIEVEQPADDEEHLAVKNQIKEEIVTEVSFEKEIAAVPTPAVEEEDKKEEIETEEVVEEKEEVTVEEPKVEEELKVEEPIVEEPEVATSPETEEKKEEEDVVIVEEEKPTEEIRDRSDSVVSIE